MKLIQISDTHLSGKRAYAYKNWEAALKYIEKSKPDLVIHTGDIVLDDPDDQEDLKFGFEQLNRIPAPWKVLPGGHDVGDSPPDPWMDQYISMERLERYLEYYKEDKWAFVFDDWYFIGLNCQLFGSNLVEEQLQWEFLKYHLGNSREKPIALFFHKPPCEQSFDEKINTVSYIPMKSRRKLFNLIIDYPVSVICVGHRHQYLSRRCDGISVIEAPTTGLISKEDKDYKSKGILTNGLIEYIFHKNGFHHKLVDPEGAERVDYGSLDESIPRGSRFLPLFPIQDLS